MDRFEALRPLLSDIRPGHLWTGRLELWAIIETIEDWIATNGLDFEAVALRDYFRSLPATSYTREQCSSQYPLSVLKFTGQPGGGSGCVAGRLDEPILIFFAWKFIYLYIAILAPQRVEELNDWHIEGFIVTRTIRHAWLTIHRKLRFVGVFWIRLR